LSVLYTAIRPWVRDNPAPYILIHRIKNNFHLAVISDSILILISIFLYSLRQIDLEVLRRLHRKVNVVPVIAKADTLTTHEVKKLKERILADIEEHEIQVA